MNTNTYIEEKNSKELCAKIIYKFNHYYYRPRRPGTGIKYSAEEMKQEFLFRKHSVLKNRTTFSDVRLMLPEIFRWNDPQSHAPLKVMLNGTISNDKF